MKKKPITEIDKLAAAYLRSQGLNQEAIADVLGISQSAVSRALTDPKVERCLREEVHFLKDQLDDPERQMREIQERVGRTHLAKRIAAHADISEADMPEIRVFPCGQQSDWDQRVTMLGRSAAGFVAELIERADSCGVTWGRHVQAVIAGVELIADPNSRQERRLEVLPLCGDSTLRPVPSDQSAAVLAMRLSRAFSKAGPVPRSLASVPAFIPPTFTPSERKVIEKLINLNSDYVEIFGQAGGHTTPSVKPLVEDVDMILTGVGPAVRRGDKSGQMLKAAGLKLDELSRLIIGDISAFFIEKAGLSADKKKRVQFINSCWTGLRRADLERCSEAARQSGGQRPGVVIAAAGEDRAEVLIEIARRKLSNVWLIDNTLEARLVEIVGDVMPVDAQS